MRRTVTLLLLFCTLGAISFGALGAVPGQDKRPPQPFFPDFYSGQATLQGAPAPAGVQLVACVYGCDTGFQSQPVEIQAGGRYEMLEVDPLDEALIGLPINFYLINEFGRVEAAESPAYEGIYDFYDQDLTFADPLPAGPPTPVPSSTPTPIPQPTPAVEVELTPTAVPTATPEPTAAPVPAPTPTAVLPVPGDPGVTAIPRLALIAGAIAVAAGAGLILWARRQAAK